ncbi:hypothetical protein [Streptomyces sp. NPDC058657]|uniref:hypothetical protein n=1 Tax=unclassified Streptomyces TaxID=2593676 RepID=UPI00365882B5
MSQNDPPSAPAGTSCHRATTAERGSFAYAHCTCGWRGPSRRSRDKARQDATTHHGAPDPLPSPRTPPRHP